MIFQRNSFRILIVMLLMSMTYSIEAADWLHWRGPNLNGSTEEENLPAVWSEDENTAWIIPLPGPGGATPIVCNGKVFVSSMVGSSNDFVGLCFDAKDGKIYYEAERFEGMGDIFSSPAGVKDRFYIVGHNGITFVVKHGPEFEILGQNKLDDNFSASPVIVGNNLYLRGYQNLYCIAE